MESYIDDDFVLNSRTATFSAKPGVLTNSQITGTTKALSYNTLRSYSPGRYSSGRRTLSPTALSEARRSMSPAELKKSLNDLNESSRSRSRQRFESHNNRLQRSRSSSPNRKGSPSKEYDSSKFVNRDEGYKSDYTLEKELSDSSFKEKMYRKTSDLATWCVNPVHLRNSTDPAELRNSSRISRHRSRSPSPRYRTRSPSPSSYRSVSPSVTRTRLYEEYPITGTESLAKENFPVTMSAYKIEHVNPPMSRSMVTSPPPRHLRAKPAHKWRVDGDVSHIVRGVDLVDSEPDDIDEITRMYNMTDLAPSIAAGTVHMISPYASDLASLRLNRLRIEEDHLLEAKRLAEIERLRGPQKQWYELKTPQFHYEAHKNNELIKSQDNWQELLDYRKSLKQSLKS